MKKLVSVLLAAAMCIMPIAVQAENTASKGELTEGKTVEVTFPKDGNVVYSLKPKEDTVYVIYSRTHSDQCDPFATLYDDEGNDIARNDDTDESYDFEIKVVLSAGKEYFLDVEVFTWNNRANTIDLIFAKAEKDYLTVSATKLKLDTPVKSLLIEDEYNYFEFTPEKDGYYNFYSTHKDDNEVLVQLYYVYDDVIIEMNDSDIVYGDAVSPWRSGVSVTPYLTGGKTYILEVGSYYFDYSGNINYEFAVTQNSQERSRIKAEALAMGTNTIECEDKSLAEEKYYSITPANDTFCYFTGEAYWNVYNVIIGSLVEYYYLYPVKLEKGKEYIISIEAYSDTDIYLTEDELTLTPVEGCDYEIGEYITMITNVDALTTVAEFKANFVEDIAITDRFSGEVLEDDELIYPGGVLYAVVNGKNVALGYIVYTNRFIPNFKEDSKYTFDEDEGCIYGIKEGTTVEKFKKNFEDTLLVYDCDAEEELSDDDLMTTGAWIELLLDGERYETYWETIILGDVNCDGAVNSTDFIQVRRYYLETFDFDYYPSSYAADTNGDGTINSTDFMRIRRHCLGTYNLYA